MDFVFVTGSLPKVKEAEQILKKPVKHHSLDLVEIQAVKCDEVVEAKARAAFDILKVPVVIEDTGLRICTWGHLPGALTRWFVEEVGCDGICRMLKNFEDRSAIAETVLGFYDGKHFKSFRGEQTGMIAETPKGSNGFGWDMIFIPSGAAQTFAEMAMAEKLTFSMRAKAWAALLRTA